eukprot:m51a1_g1336 hypothetical protein (681) ;mRNA; r:309630-312565
MMKAEAERSPRHSADDPAEGDDGPAPPQRVAKEKGPKRPALPRPQRVVDYLGFVVPDDEREAFVHAAQESAAREAKFLRRWKKLLDEAQWPESMPSREELLKNNRFRYLVFKGVPMAHRPAVWMSLSRARDLRAMEAPGYYTKLVQSLSLDGNTTAEEIERDLERTFPGHPMFLGEHPERGIEELRRVLVAYSARNPQVGYCQSMNVVAAWLLLIMHSEEDAFWMLCAVAENFSPRYYTPNMVGCQIDIRIFKELVTTYYPRLQQHFEDCSLSLELATTKWFLCVFVGSLPNETTLRIWDCFFLYGSVFLFRVAMAVLKVGEEHLRNTENTTQLIKLLNSFPHMLYNHVKLFNIVRDLKGVTHRSVYEMHAKYSEEVRKELLCIRRSKDVRQLAQMTKFSKNDLESFWNSFKGSGLQLDKTDRGSVAINFAQFQTVLSNFIPGWKHDEPVTLQLFRLFDSDGDSKLDFRELMVGLSMLANGSTEDKLQLMFKAYDTEKQGYLSEQVDTLFGNLDIKGDGYLSFEDFKKVVHLRPELLSYLDGTSHGDLLNPAADESMKPVDRFTRGLQMSFENVAIDNDVAAADQVVSPLASPVAPRANPVAGQKPPGTSASARPGAPILMGDIHQPLLLDEDDDIRCGLEDDYTAASANISPMRAISTEECCCIRLMRNVPLLSSLFHL